MFFGYKHDKYLLNVLTPINFLIEDIVEKKLYPVIGYIARFFFASVLFFSYLQLIVYLCTKKQYKMCIRDRPYGIFFHTIYESSYRLHYERSVYYGHYFY